MGFCHRHRSLIFFFLIFLISSSTQVRFMAEGRAVMKLMEQASHSQQVEQASHQMKGVQEQKTMNMRVMIGSRPPRCEMRCNTCRHCEAVQVPAVPQDQNHHKKSAASNQHDMSTKVIMRGDDTSNYKPMSWKCKCGDMIFNP